MLLGWYPLQGRQESAQPSAHAVVRDGKQPLTGTPLLSSIRHRPHPHLLAETKKMSERLEWVDKRSSRIWRGRLEARYWRYIKGSGEGMVQ